MTNIRKSLVLLVVAFASTATVAGAQSPTDSVYNPDNGVLGVVGSGTPTPTPTPTSTPAATQEETTPAAPKQSTPSTTAAPQSTPVATPPTTQQVSKPGELPFTGMEAGLVGILGLALLGGGIAMRRMTREDA